MISKPELHPVKNNYEVHMPGFLVPIENLIGYLRWPTKIWVLGRRAYNVMYM